MLKIITILALLTGNIYILFLIIFYFHDYYLGLDCLNLCGDWVQYNNKESTRVKCYKVIQKLVTQSEAINECKSLDSSATLVTIRNSDEQAYFNQYLLKNANKSDQIWIGLKWDSNDKFNKWVDGSIVDFNHWSQDAAKDGSEKCACMSTLADNHGEW